MGKSHMKLRAACAAAVMLGSLVAAPAIATAEPLAPEPAGVPNVQTASDIEAYQNNHDYSYTFTLTGNHQNGGTPFEDKTDNTSTYIWIKTYSGSPVRLYTDGAYNKSGFGSLDCTEGIYRSNHPGEWQMYNQVHERGRSASRLTAWREKGDGAVSGLWSPDCAGQWNYGVLPS